MRTKHSNPIPALRRRGLPAALALAVGFAAAWSTPAASAEAVVSSQDVFWTWDPSAVTGTSTLVRTNKGLNAELRTSDLPAGTAMTLWIIVFNNPDQCATSPCSSGDLFDEDVQGDFLYAGGNIVGGSGRSSFAGHVGVGDISGSGHLEIGTGGLAVGVLNPYGAEVHLAVHSHGLASTGQTLKQQISSFLGGCEVFLGNAFGVAEGPDDVPLAAGECSTIQVAVYQP